MRDMRGQYNYRVDKAFGDGGEEMFIKFLNETGFYDIKKNDGTAESFSSWDIEAWRNNKRWTFEIKTDARAADTPNLCVEHSRLDGTPSGVSVTTADFFVSIIPGLGEIWVIETPRLLELIKENEGSFKSYPMGDNKGTLGYLLNRNKFKRYYRSIHRVKL